MSHQLDEQGLVTALEELSLLCPLAKKWWQKVGTPEPRIRERGIKTLAQTICGQQISVAAARAIWLRIEAACGEEVTAESLGALSYDELRALGHSHRKAEYTQGLAKAMIEGELDLEGLPILSDEDATKHLVALRGFGPWTAQIYLLFAEGRRDIWPADDLALQEGLKTIFKLDERPTAKDTLPLIEHWRPYRGAGALLVWKVYGSTTLG
ncbi:MAG: DNA-3-methyladenine glycosylase family protein [Alphaproteobacteria bacterium]